MNGFMTIKMRFGFFIVLSSLFVSNVRGDAQERRIVQFSVATGLSEYYAKYPKQKTPEIEEALSVFVNDSKYDEFIDLILTAGWNDKGNYNPKQSDVNMKLALDLSHEISFPVMKRAISEFDLPIRLFEILMRNRTSENANELLKKIISEEIIDVNAAINNIHTPLILACLHKDVDMLRLLLKHSADPNQTDLEKKTPLHEAVEQRCFTCVEELLKAGANKSLRNKYGLTPLEMAQERINNDYYKQNPDSDMEKVIELLSRE